MLRPRLLMRALWLAFVLLGMTALAADKPAALQVCVQLPEGVPLFSNAPGRYLRALGNDTWMLDFDVVVNGHGVERVTKSGPDCLRLWMPAERVSAVGLTFSRLPLNLIDASQAMSVQLKADLWSDGGKLVVERAPWAAVQNLTDGVLVLERPGVVVDDLGRVPRGTYAVKFTAKELPRSDCPITLVVNGSGTVRADRNAALYRELTEFYRAEFLPGIIKRQKVQCDPAETAQVTVQLVDGAFRDPLSPKVQRVRIEEREPKYLLSVDGQTMPFVDGMPLTLEPGQQVEFSEQTLRAAR